MLGSLPEAVSKVEAHVEQAEQKINEASSALKLMDRVASEDILLAARQALQESLFEVDKAIKALTGH